jgi:hypothetical protein
MAIDLSNPSLRDAEFRKGEFRETARDIVWKDRNSKKYGRSVDTGGAIARAMEAAYRLGVSHGGSHKVDVPDARRSTPSQDAAIAWNTIPPRPRAIFERIVTFKWIVMLVSDAAPWERYPDKWACYRDRGNNKSETERYVLAHTFSRSTLTPIDRLGLMVAKVVDGDTFLVQTPKAAATWADALSAGHVREAY